MVRRLLLIVLVLGLVWAVVPRPAGSAVRPDAGAASRHLAAARGAVRLITPRGRPLQGLWQLWADASLVPTVAARVVVHLARCPARPQAAGCVFPARPRSMWIRPGSRSARGVMLHELGHLYDLRVLNNRDRGRFRHLLGRSRKRKWWVGGTPLAEQFAEAYSWCARYARIVSIRRYSTYHYRPTPKQHQRICRLIKRTAGDGRPAAPPPARPVVTGPDPQPAPPPLIAPGVVPGDPVKDPGPQPPEDPDEPLSLPSPSPSPVPSATPTITPIYPLPTPPGTH